jgi:hypothetical protein
MSGTTITHGKSRQNVERQLRPAYAQTGPRLVAAGHHQPVPVEATGDDQKQKRNAKKV